jgi:hypothetical protein
MGGACSTNGRRETRIGYWQESERKNTTWKTRRWWVDNNKVNLGEIVCVGIDWIDVAED